MLGVGKFHKASLPYIKLLPQSLPLVSFAFTHISARSHIGGVASDQLAILQNLLLTLLITNFAGH